MNTTHLLDRVEILITALLLPLMLFSQTAIQKDSLAHFPKAIEISAPLIDVTYKQKLIKE